jgi:hypothetical protein
MRGRNF